MCSKHFEESSEGITPFLSKMLDYFNKFFKKYVEIIYSKAIFLEPSLRQSLLDIIERITYYIYESHAHKLVIRIFDIILEAEEINIIIIREIRESVEHSNLVICFLNLNEDGSLSISLEQANQGSFAHSWSHNPKHNQLFHKYCENTSTN